MDGRPLRGERGVGSRESDTNIRQASMGQDIYI